MKMEDDLNNFFKTRMRTFKKTNKKNLPPQKWKTTSKKMEGDLKKNKKWKTT